MQEVNVQVAVRVRPLLHREKAAGEVVCVRIIPTTNQIVLGRDRVFTFDHIFLASATQADIYGQCIEPLVQSCFEGYNATVFAYGQTGSGKTYTIGGGSALSQTSENVGMIARAIQQIFKVIEGDSSRKFSVRVSYIEIYRDELHDLIDSSLNKDIHIREDNHGNTMIVGAMEVECDTADDVMSYLERGSAYRHTGSTQMNEKSSRSHAVFTVLIEQRRHPVETGRRPEEILAPAVDISDSPYKCAKFHFVDLAGSERAHRTGNVGQRFKESIHINTGLLALGNVISALGDIKKKTTHIPYRDSKITRLLKDSLGGNAKTLMICCISPSSANLDESLNSLKYANRARSITNKPVINLDPQTAKIEVMETEIKSLREQLFRATTATTFGRDGETGEEPGLNDIRQELERVNSVCRRYKALSEEAYLQLSEFRDLDFLSNAQNQRLYDWLELMDETNDRIGLFNEETDNHPTLFRLQKELEQCHRDLQNDAEIFLEKNEEINSIREKAVQLEADNEEMGVKMEEAERKINQLEEELLAKQMEMDKLTDKIKEMQAVAAHGSLDVSVNVSSHPFHPHSTRPGAKSAPIRRTLVEGETAKEAPSRDIHTSPPTFTVEHVLHNFRARSQMLAAHLEDGDSVLAVKYDSDGVEGDVNDKCFERSTNSRRTYRVKESHAPPSAGQASDNSFPQSRTGNRPQKGSRVAANFDAARADSKLSQSNSNQKLKQTEINLCQSTTKFRNLTINIRMKEQLIRQLVKNEKDAQEVNRIFLEKIQSLEKEKMAVKTELVNIQKDYELKQQQDKALNEHLQSEFRKKMEAAKSKLKSLNIQRKETESMVSLTNNDKKIQELQMSISSMKQQLKREAELREKLEGDVRTEYEEMENMKLQRMNNGRKNAKDELRAKDPEMSDEQLRLDEQRKWLDQEMEKLLEQRKAAEELEKELKQREELLAKKESIMAEKRELEMKVVRSNRISDEGIRESSKVDRLDAGDFHQRLDNEMRQIRMERDRLHQQRQSLSGRMQEKRVLSAEDQRKLMEIEEAMEAMDAALDYKSELISQKQLELRRSMQALPNQDSTMSKLRFLSASEARALLRKYFEKVVDLRDAQRKLELRCEELEAVIEEERSLVHELETSLQHSAMEMEMKLAQKQHEYEHKLQLMMKNLTQSEFASRPKIAELEKELYFYKTTCRSLKKQLRESSDVSHSVTVSNKNDSLSEGGAGEVEKSSNVATPRSAAHSTSSRGVSQNGQSFASPRDGVQLPSTSPRVNTTGTPRDNGVSQFVDSTPNGSASTSEPAPPKDAYKTPVHQNGRSAGDTKKVSTHRKTENTEMNASEMRFRDQGGQSRKRVGDAPLVKEKEKENLQLGEVSGRSRNGSDVSNVGLKSPRMMRKSDMSLVVNPKILKDADPGDRAQSGTNRQTAEQPTKSKLYDSLEI